MPLTVKLASICNFHDLRKSTSKPTPLPPGSSKTAKYIRSLKEHKPDRYEEHLKQDRLRKQGQYTPIDLKSPAEKEATKRRWAQVKRLQRGHNCAAGTDSGRKTTSTAEDQRHDKRGEKGVRPSEKEGEQKPAKLTAENQSASKGPTSKS